MKKLKMYLDFSFLLYIVLIEERDKSRFKVSDVQ